MRRSLLLVLVLLSLSSAGAVSAQLFPNQEPGPAPSTTRERIVFDATLMVIPPFESGPCMQLESGRLTVRASNQGGVDARAARFTLNGYRGSDPPGRIDLTIGAQESATTIPLAGGLYCWSWDVTVPLDVTMDSGMAVRTSYSQMVALKLTLATP